MQEEALGLCCCEYYDNLNQRNHILACCCNCVDIDEAFESVISGKPVSSANKSGLMYTFHDRLRIPWPGGAKQVAFDNILPVFILPIMLLLASISVFWTVFSFTTVLIFLIVTFNFFLKTIPKTKFFFMWTISSIISLYIIFEFIVIPIMTILFDENIILSLYIFWFIMCLYIMKVRTNRLNTEDDGEIENAQRNIAKFSNCIICERRIPDKDHHCVWFDCCIGQHNRGIFITSLIVGTIALLYSANLTLTSVCHPFVIYTNYRFYRFSILLPDNCSEAYLQSDLSLSFISAVYSLVLALILITLLLQQILLVSLGLSLREWRKLPLREKLCLGLLSRRRHSKGFLKNWMSLMSCFHKNQYSVVNEL